MSRTPSRHIAVVAGIALSAGIFAAQLAALPQTALATEQTQVEATVTDAAEQHVSTVKEFRDAVNGAPRDGSTVTIVLDNDISDSGDSFSHTLAVHADASIIVDMGGHTLEITYTNGMAASINRGRLVLRNGTLKSTRPVTTLENHGTLTIEKSATIRNAYTKTLASAPHVIDNYGGVVNIAGSVISDHNGCVQMNGGTANMTGGKVQALGGDKSWSTGFDVFCEDGAGGTKPATVSISDGSIETLGYAVSVTNGKSNDCDVTISGGEIETQITSVYWPESGHLVIGDTKTGDGPSITSTNGSAVEICAGTLDVYGGTLDGGAEKCVSSDEIGGGMTLADMYRAQSGSASVGDGVTVIANRAKAYAEIPLDVNIHGGTLNGSENYGLRYLDVNQEDGIEQVTNAGVSVLIDGGTLMGGIAPFEDLYVAESDLGFISSGNMLGAEPNEIDDNLADGRVIVRMGDDNVICSEDEALQYGCAYKSLTDDGTPVYFESNDDADAFASGSAHSPVVEAVTFDVTFDQMLQGIEPVIIADVLNGSTVGTLDGIPQPTCDGYEFAGWFDNKGCEGEAVVLGDLRVLGDDVTLYAKWDANGDGEKTGGDEKPGDGEQGANENAGDSGSAAAGDETGDGNGNDGGDAGSGTEGSDDSDDADTSDIMQTGVASAAPVIGVGAVLSGIGALVSMLIGRGEKWSR